MPGPGRSAPASLGAENGVRSAAGAGESGAGCVGSGRGRATRGNGRSNGGEARPGAVTKKQIHLAQFLCHGPTYHSLAMWRHPRTAAAGYDWARPELYQHIARVCERGKFDMVFLMQEG